MALEIPEALKAVEHYSVRGLARMPGRASSALFDVAAARKGKHTWTPGEWAGLLRELDMSDKTVGQWLLE